jgi:uncharacterized membrane protein HdeD (DUF308 family)
VAEWQAEPVFFYLVGMGSVLLTKPLASAVCVVALVGSCLLLREVLRECRPLKEQ